MSGGRTPRSGSNYMQPTQNLNQNNMIQPSPSMANVASDQMSQVKETTNSN
jgi:hypothetical protein